MRNNVIVGQSGGPTSVINSSLAGVFHGAKKCGANKVYGMRHGILGFLDEQYIDLSEQITNNLDMEILKRTPAAFLGTCRYKLPNLDGHEDVYKKIFEIIDKLNIGYFFYIGGNDSMDTICKLAEYAKTINHPTRFMGVPKTIDNDLAVTDHTPGFGSAAKYIGTSLKEVITDNLSFAYDTKIVCIVEIMGRNAGWLTGAAALAKGEDCVGPDMIYLPEIPFDVNQFMTRVKEILPKKKCITVCVSEGIKTADGKYVCELGGGSDYVDAFGHKQLTGTARTLANMVSAELGCKTRAIELSTLQRSASHLASRTDITEAFQVGEAAATAAFEGETGKMIILKRLSNNPYICTTDVYDIRQIANAERVVPREWMNEAGDYITEEFRDYMKPLVEGEVLPIQVDGISRFLYIR